MIPTRKIARALLCAVPFSVRYRIKAVPGVARLQRAIIMSLLDGQQFEHQVDAGPAMGITFFVKMPEDKGIWTGTYESDFAARLAAAVQPGMVTYDVGSWHGFFAGVMAAQGAREVHVFEPLPANLDRLAKLVALNPTKHIEVHACAVGELDGELDLLIMPDTSMAKLATSGFQGEKTSSKRVRVLVRSIDSMVGAGEIAPPSLMKIDVEGAEAMALLGAQETIARYRPQIFAEVHSSALLEQCRAIFDAMGYSVKTTDCNTASALADDVFQIEAAPTGLS